MHGESLIFFFLLKCYRITFFRILEGKYKITYCVTLHGSSHCKIYHSYHFFFLNILLLQQQVATELSKTENKVYFTKIFVVISYVNDLFAWDLHKPL